MAIEDYYDINGPTPDDYFQNDDDFPFDLPTEKIPLLTKGMKKMSKKQKPILIAVGNHMIDPNDVVCISKIRDKNLYIVRLKSQPNMEYPIWVKAIQIESLLNHFEIKTSDIQGDLD